MSEIITLTEKDFSMMNEALDALTKHRHPMEGMMFEIMTEKLIGSDKVMLEQMKREKALHDDRERKKVEAITEEVRLLQAKLIQLKRELIAKANLKETDSLINFVK
jgi:hypothetical protein